MAALTIPEREILTIYLHEPEKFDSSVSYNFHAGMSSGLSSTIPLLDMSLRGQSSEEALEEEDY